MPGEHTGSGHAGVDPFRLCDRCSSRVVWIHFWLTEPEESKSILFGFSAVCRDKLPELRLSASSSSAAD